MLRAALHGFIAGMRTENKYFEKPYVKPGKVGDDISKAMTKVKDGDTNVWGGKSDEINYLVQFYLDVLADPAHTEELKKAGPLAKPGWGLFKARGTDGEQYYEDLNDDASRGMAFSEDQEGKIKNPPDDLFYPGNADATKGVVNLLELDLAAAVAGDVGPEEDDFKKGKLKTVS